LLQSDKQHQQAAAQSEHHEDEADSLHPSVDTDEFDGFFLLK
jgi:hypothetical protein